MACFLIRIISDTPCPLTLYPQIVMVNWDLFQEDSAEDLTKFDEIAIGV